MAGEMAAKIANAIATSFSGVVDFANQVQAMSSHHITTLQADNHRLEAALRACNNERLRLEDDFDKFKRRTTQREILAQLKAVEIRFDKLRTPDVTLEQMHSAIEGMKKQRLSQNGKINQFKDSCAKELEKLAASRKEFNRDAKAHKVAREHKLRDLGNEIKTLDEKLEHKIHRDNQTHLEVHEFLHSHENAATNMAHDLAILKQHVTVLANDEQQNKINGALSGALHELRDEQYMLQMKIDEKVQETW
jgi:hypothetical protein